MSGNIFAQLITVISSYGSHLNLTAIIFGCPSTLFKQQVQN